MSSEPCSFSRTYELRGAVRRRAGVYTRSVKRSTRLHSGGACVQRVFNELLDCAGQVKHHLRRARALAAG